MKKKRRLLLLLLLLLAVGASAATHLKVEPLTGVEQQFAVSQIGKITFTEGVMYLFDKSGEQLGSTPVNQVGKIFFGEGQNNPTSLDEAAVATVQVFPNPTQEMLVVRGLQGTQTVRIYNLQGQLMQSAVINDGEANLHVGGLQNGTYLLQAGAEVVKFLKE